MRMITLSQNMRIDLENPCIEEVLFFNLPVNFGRNLGIKIFNAEIMCSNLNEQINTLNDLLKYVLVHISNRLHTIINDLFDTSTVLLI